MGFGWISGLGTGIGMPPVRCSWRKRREDEKFWAQIVSPEPVIMQVRGVSLHIRGVSGDAPAG